MKSCANCRQDKPESAFGKWSKSADGLQRNCKDCVREYKTRWKANRSLEQREQDRQKHCARARVFREKHPDRAYSNVRRWKLRRFGLSQSDFDAMFARQHGKCGVCCTPLRSGSETHIDHDHATGQVRGLLCNRCNLAIGLLKDSPLTAERLAAYLRKNAPSLLVILERERRSA